ncbi:MAG TPA: hypothetical protein VIO36_06060 [Anaerolineaceae bacterium]
MRQHPALILILLLCLITGGCGQGPAVSPTAAPGTPLPQPTAPVVLPTQIATDPAGEPVTIEDIFFWDAQNGWGIGKVAKDPFDHVLRTADAGNTWVDITPVGAVADPQSANTAAVAAFLDVAHAWVLYFQPTPASPGAQYLVWYTGDGGETWQASQPLQLPAVLDFFMPSEMGFSDASNGWLMAHLGAGMSHDYVALYKTADGGQTWQSVVDPSQDGVISNSLPMTCTKNGVAFQDAMTGWVTGGCNGVLPGLFLYQTNDGGLTWLPVTLPPPENAPSLLADETNVCSTSHPEIREGFFRVQVSCTISTGGNVAWLYTSQSDGQAWGARSLPAAFGSVDLQPSGPMWMLGTDSIDQNAERELYRSVDGGSTWQTIMADLNWQGLLNFVDNQDGFALVSVAEAPRLIKTNDGGQTWVEVDPLIVPAS